MLSPVNIEFVPQTEPALVREQFAHLGHVGITGLYNPAVGEQALAEIRKRFIKSKLSGSRAYNARLSPPVATEKAYGSIIEAIQQGARLLGRDIAPAVSGEATQIDLLEMEKNGRGLKHRDKPELVDVVAVTNLDGFSSLRIEDGDGSGNMSEYTFGPGVVIYHDLEKELLHQGFTGPDQLHALD